MPAGTAWHWLATLVLLVHLGFVLFVILGGLLVLRRPWLAWIHLPAVAWGVLIEYADWICPLTPLENAFRSRGGETPYAGSFIEHYLTATIYPSGLSRGLQFALGTFALLLNAILYFLISRRYRAR